MAGHEQHPGSDSTPTSFDGPKTSGSIGFGERLGEKIGPYKILSVLGEGGFGIVYLAERREPFVQRVALKVIKPGMDSKAVIARFEQERQALAVIDHPNVARVFDAGATPLGRPYFAMELVQGEPITEYCDRHQLTVRQRLELFISVCEAVQHAHMKGIIHRDIKPSKILVTVREGQPITKVIDFGVAKAITHTLTDKTVFTETGQLIGTPEYMSPEQAEMGALDIDTRTDVYSLGVVLYELLAGAAPFDSKELRSKGYAEIQRFIRESEPPRPSARLTKLGGPEGAEIARRRKTRTDDLAGVLRRELEWIPLKAIRKDRTERYQTARELAEDTRRYLSGLPLRAGPESSSYRLRKLLRRNRATVGAGAAVLGTLLLGLAATSYGLVQAKRESQRARREAEKAQVVANFMTVTLEGAGPSVAKGRDTAMLKEMMDGAAHRLESGELTQDPEAEARLRASIGDTYRQIGQYDEAERMLAPAPKIAGAALGRDNELVATTLNDLALVRMSQGRMPEAELLLKEALDSRRKADPPNYRAVESSLINLASAIQNQGRLPEAEALFREALDVGRKAGGDDADSARAMNNLALLMQAQNRLPEAEALCREALSVYRRALGNEHPDLAKGVGNLAFILRLEGKLADAEPLMRETLTVQRKLLGDDHPDVAASLNNLAAVLRDLKRPAEAEPLFREAISIYDRKLSPGHWLGGNSHLGLGRTLLAESRFADAQTELETAEKILGAPEGVPPGRHRQAVEALIALHEKWDAAEPGKGHAEKAEPWRASLAAEDAAKK